MSVDEKIIDETDRKLLNYLQESFPTVPEPFKTIGEKLSITEDEAYRRVQKLKDLGIIRRIGAVFDTRKMGFTSTLVAASVPEEQLETFVEMVNSLAGVTHNYRRNHLYNVWFTLISRNEEELKETLEKLRAQSGIREIVNLSSVRTFKINARFNFADNE